MSWHQYRPNNPGETTPRRIVVILKVKSIWPCHISPSSAGSLGTTAPLSEGKLPVRMTLNLGQFPFIWSQLGHPDRCIRICVRFREALRGTNPCRPLVYQPHEPMFRSWKAQSLCALTWKHDQGHACKDPVILLFDKEMENILNTASTHSKQARKISGIGIVIELLYIWQM